MILVEAGEKMGLQITVLLSDIIYVDILQNTVPVFDTFGNSPLILSFFIVSIVLLTVCLLGIGRIRFNEFKSTMICCYGFDSH